MPAPLRWWLNILNGARLEAPEGYWDHVQKGSGHWPQSITKTCLYEMFCEANKHERHRPSVEEFGQYIFRILPNTHRRRTINGRRMRIWELPPHNECIELFDAHYPGFIEASNLEEQDHDDDDSGEHSGEQHGNDSVSQPNF